MTNHQLQIIGHNDKHNATLHYNITGLHPLTNYTFILYIIDYFNNTKDKEQIIFSEFILLYNNQQ